MSSGVKFPAVTKCAQSQRVPGGVARRPVAAMPSARDARTPARTAAATYICWGDADAMAVTMRFWPPDAARGRPSNAHGGRSLPGASWPRNSDSAPPDRGYPPRARPASRIWDKCSARPPPSCVVVVPQYETPSGLGDSLTSNSWRRQTSRPLLEFRPTHMALGRFA
jgi:hypothetical protein